VEPLATAAICDDVRVEINGKPFIIGVYTHTMSFAELPATLAQIMVLVTIFSDINDPITKFTVNVEGPGSETSADFDVGPLASPQFSDATRAEISAVVTINPFVVSEPGILSVTVRYSGGELRARRLPIQLVTQAAPTPTDIELD
jgi:hypothetical protein